MYFIVEWKPNKTERVTHIRRFETLAYQKQDSNHASDLVPQESTAFDLHCPELIIFIPARDERETEINKINQLIVDALTLTSSKLADRSDTTSYDDIKKVLLSSI